MAKGLKAISYEEHCERVRRAIYRSARNGDGYAYDDWNDDFYVELIYDGYAIIRADEGTYYRVDYTEAEGVVTVPARNEWQRVEKEWAAKSLILAFGGTAIKQLEDGSFLGLLVHFSSEDDPDLTGDFFNDSTDFDIEDGAKTTLYYNHGLDPVLKRRKIGTGTLHKDDVGIWTKFQLEQRDDYERSIAEMTIAGKMGMSSGTAAHLVEREAVGKAYHIKRWPLGLDASITPTPAEPRTTIVPLKSYESQPLQPEAAAQVAGDATAAAEQKSAGAPILIQSKSKETNHMSGDVTLTAADLEILRGIKGYSEKIDAVIKYIENAPAIQSAGVVSPDGGRADKNIKSFADFLVAVKRRDYKRLETQYGAQYLDENDSVKSVNEGTGAEGGFTVPAEYVTRLLEIAGGPMATVRPRAYKQPMRTRTLSMPALDQSQTPSSGVNHPMMAGVAAYWTEEEGESQESDPKFRSLQLEAHKLTGHTKASNEYLADGAISLEALLYRLFGGAVAFCENHAFLRGNGVGKPLGVLNAAARIEIARAGSGNNFELADAKGMLKRFMRSSRTSALWVMHPFMEVELIDLALSGTSTLVTYMPNLTDAIPLRLFGIPVTFDDCLPAPGTKGDVMLCDFSYYVIGDRQQLTIASSEHADFTRGRMVWRFEHRVDGQPWLNAPIYLADGENTVSPFVVLS